MTRNRKTGSRSRKVYLRPPEQGDFDELAALYLASRKHLSGLATTVFDRERFDGLLTGSQSEANEFFLICRTDGDDIVGQINFSQIFRKAFQNAYLGYQLFAGCTGYGYMTEAVALALEFAFKVLKLHRIEANVQPGNLPSIKVLERNGFTKEGYSRRYLKIGGRWRDHERWAIIREDWNKG